MSISFVGAQGAAGTTVTIPAHQSGDMILIFAYRDGSNTAPTVPTAGGTVPTWTLIGTSGGNTNSSRFHRAVATGSTTTSGTWTNATELICLVYRGTKLVGASAGGSGSATTTVNYPALTLQRTDNSSWVVGVAGHRTATNVEVAPSGMTNRASSGTEAAGHDSNGTRTSWTSTNVTVNASSAFRSWTVELRDATVVLTADAGSFNDTFIDASLERGRFLTAEKGTYTETGISANLIYGANPNKLLTAEPGSFTETGIAAGIRQTAILVADKATYTETGVAATLRHAVVITAAKGTFVESGVAADIRESALLSASNGTYALTGISATVRPARKLVAQPGPFSLSGNSANLVEAGLTAVTLTADSGSFVLTGVQAGFQRASFLSAAGGSAALVGVATDIRHAARLSGSPGTFIESGNAAAISRVISVTATPGSITLSGQQSVRARSYRLTASTGSFLRTGNAVGIRVTRVLDSDTGLLTETGNAAVLRVNRPLLANTGSYALSGVAAGKARTYIIKADPIEYFYGGNDSYDRARQIPEPEKVYAGSFVRIDPYLKVRRIPQRRSLSNRIFPSI